MSDRYAGFTQSSVGRLLVKQLGLPNPMPLDRWTEGSSLVDGTVVVGGSGRLSGSLTGVLDGLGISSTTATTEGEKYKGLVFDATGITTTADLLQLQQFFTPLMRSS